LALNGTLAAAFRGEGVEFDNEQGAFKVQRHPCGPIGLTGHGAAALWTARALERLGYEVVKDNQAMPVQVHIAGSNGSTRWHVSKPNGNSEYKSLTDVIQHLG